MMGGWDKDAHRRWRTLESIRKLWEQYPDRSLTQLLWEQGLFRRGATDEATVLLDDDAVWARLYVAYQQTPSGQAHLAALASLLQMGQEMDDDG